MSDMDEFEIEALLDAIDALDPLLNPTNTIEYDEILSEQVRDENGHRVEGCYHIRPANIYG